MPFISFCCLIAVARTSRTVKSQCENGHRCLVHDSTRKALSFSSLRMILVVCFSYIAFIMLRYVSSTLLRAFIMNGCCTLSKAFSASIKMNIWFLSILLLMWCITLICGYWTTLVTRNKSHLIMVNDFFNDCWIQFASIFLRIFASLFIRDIGLQLSFLVVSLSGFDIRVILT